MLIGSMLTTNNSVETLKKSYQSYYNGGCGIMVYRSAHTVEKLTGGHRSSLYGVFGVTANVMN